MKTYKEPSAEELIRTAQQNKMSVEFKNKQGELCEFRYNQKVRLVFIQEACLCDYGTSDGLNPHVRRVFLAQNYESSLVESLRFEGSSIINILRQDDSSPELYESTNLDVLENIYGQEKPLLIQMSFNQEKNTGTIQIQDTRSNKIESVPLENCEKAERMVFDQI
ncbi:MAG: hypothetical protein KDD50_04080 [Bdellovibrionales bacterium]|nr:hypothetical protein [Bdellovibrionales bacterium]